MMVQDAELLNRYVRDQDADAFSELVKKYAGMVYATSLRVARNPHDAEDAAQESFLELARRADTVKASLAGWLHWTATSKAKMSIRKEVSRRERETAAAPADTEENAPTWEEMAPHVDDALEQLPADLRTALVLHYLQGKNQTEVAEALGLDQSTVSRRLKSGIKELRSELKKVGFGVTAALLAGTLGANAMMPAPATLVTSLGNMAMTGVGGAVGTGAVVGFFGTVAGKAAALILSTALLICAVAIYKHATKPDPVAIAAAVVPPEDDSGIETADKPAPKASSEAAVYPYRVRVSYVAGLEGAQKKEVIRAMEKQFPGTFCFNFSSTSKNQELRIPKGMSLKEALKKYAKVKGVKSVTTVPIRQFKTHGGTVMVLFKDGTTGKQRRQVMQMIKGAVMEYEYKYTINGFSARLPKATKTMDAIKTYAYAPNVVWVSACRVMASPNSGMASP